MGSYFDNLNAVRRKYDELLSRAEKVMESFNICQIDENGLCARSRARLEAGTHKYQMFNCCGDPDDRDLPVKCFYLQPGAGCTTTCLFCKVSFCDFIKPSIPPELLEELDTLLKEAFEYNLVDFRLPRGITLVRHITKPEESSS